MPKEKVSERRKTSRRTGFLLGILAAAVVLLLQQYPFMKRIFTTYDNRLLDYRLAYRAKSPQSQLDERIQLISITDVFLNLKPDDDDSVYHREPYFHVFDFLAELGVRMVIYDVIFLHERDWDSMLAFRWEETQNAHIAYYFELTGQVTEEEPENLALLEPFSFPYDPQMGGRPPEAKGVVLPSEILLEAAKGAGFINITPDVEDGINRHMPMLIKFKDRIYPSLSLMAVCDYYKVPIADLQVAFGKSIRIPLPGGAVADIPIDEEGKLLISYREGEGFINRAIPFIKVVSVDNTMNPAELKEFKKSFEKKIVLIGVVAAGATDIVPIPLQSRFPAVGIHANIINSILKKDFLFTVSYIWQVIIVLCIGLFSGLVISRLSYIKGFALAVMSATGYFLISFLLFSPTAVILPVMSPLAAFVVSYVFVALYLLLTEEKETRRVKQIFGQFAAPVVVKEILKNYENPALWGSRQRITVLYSDIRGFTHLSEVLSSDEIVDLLDRYYRIVEEAVFGNNGMINKFLGDGVLVIYGAPYQTDTPETDAVRSAMEIQNNVGTLNELPLVERIGIKIGVGVGIHSGDAVVGIVGRGKRSEYTALGDVVNTTDRIQGLAKSGEIVVTDVVKSALERTSDHLPYNVAFSQLPHVTLKGKTKEISLYTITREEHEGA